MAVNKIIRNCGVYEYDERELKIKISCGASIAPLEASNAEQLLRSADIALRHAETNELEYVRYTDCPVKTITPVLQLEAELESAIKGGDLDAFFQPVIDVESGGLTEIEILTRWTRGASANATEPVLAAFTQAGVKQDHCSSINNGGGLRTRVEVTHRK